ncbi:HPr kinase/phosphorylase [Crenalkalicoccus roseus]|uniref:HPr kinase/phosphorylase n=1 Tax=Crenalkalicoccus roseus TaxID=1485588 RepID=UPI00107FF482|nr:HPr kinase/phosphatase C-terminal domain-containing protein [Crenalkalicoccus roseus]
MLVHGSCVALGGDAVLLLGPSGSGKSDLALRLIHEGWRLVADDQVALRVEEGGLLASAPPALAGMLEVRGLGIFRSLPVAEPAPALRLAVHLAPREGVPRLPEPATWRAAGIAVPAVALHGLDASAPARIAFALGAATGRLRQRAGAFTAEEGA